VNATGTIAITGGTYNSNGDLTLNGGDFARDATGTFALDPGRTFTVQNGGDATFTGAFGVAGSTTYNITGTGSTLTVTGTTTIGMSSGGTATVNIGNGGTFTTGTGQTTVNATGDLNINAGGTMIVRGNMTVHSSLEIAGTVILAASAPAPAEETDDRALADSAFEAGDTPHFGDRFDFIDAGNVVGSFDAIDLPALNSGVASNATQLHTNVQLRIVPEPSVGTMLLAGLALLGRRRGRQGAESPCRCRNL
jgi:hypothetical protein